MVECNQTKQEQQNRAIAYNGGGSRQLKEIVNNNPLDQRQSKMIAGIYSNSSNILQMNPDTAKDYADDAEGIRCEINANEEPEYASYKNEKFALTIAVNDSNFTYCGGGYSKNQFIGTTYRRRRFEEGTPYMHTEQKLLTKHSDTKNMGVSRKVCNNCQDSLKSKSMGAQLEDVCAKFDDKYYFYQPPEYTEKSICINCKLYPPTAHNLCLGCLQQEYIDYIDRIDSELMHEIDEQDIADQEYY